MLGRSVGLGEDKLDHLGDEPLPDGVYDAAEKAIVRYAQVSTRSITIDDDLYGDLEEHFSVPQIMELCGVVGLSNLVNRFHATFLTDVDESTIEVVEAGDRANGSCPLPRRPGVPGG